MSNEITKPDTKAVQSAKTLLNSDAVKKKFVELLGKPEKATAFITSVLQSVNNNDLLSKADPMTVLHAATVAATLSLPINPNLGFAYIVPYNSKNGCQAQFQMGYKGFIQLALRSGQFKKISACEIYEGQIKSENKLQGFDFDFKNRSSDKIIGYAAYFRLVNGFEAEHYMTVEELQKHGKRFSQTFKRGFGLWNDDFHSMALKTVIKLLLSKWAPLSVEMIQQAVVVDQSVINNDSATDFTYIDNTEEKPDKELERASHLIADAQSTEELKSFWDSFGDDIRSQLSDVMETKYQELEK